MAVDHDKKTSTLKVHMKQYIHDLKSRFLGEGPVNSQKTPADSSVRMRPAQSDDEVLPESFPYKELVGSLMFLSVSCRPDIALAVNQVARCMQRPTKLHWLAAKRILRYLFSTVDYCLIFKQHPEFQTTTSTLHGYSDSDYGGVTDSKNRRRSVSGNLIYLDGNLIHWSARVQRTPTLSVCESELISAVELAQDCMFIKNILKDMGIDLKDGTYAIKTDSAGVHKMVQNPVYVGRMRHIDLRYHFLRHQVVEGSAVCDKVEGKLNPADAFTKPLTSTVFHQHPTKFKYMSRQ